MTYKVNGTVVVDDSRNVCACCVCSCCVSASGSLSAPSGTTAQRPTGSVGEIYFDTDEGKLFSHNGTDWSQAGGGGASIVPDDVVSASSEAWAIGYVNTMQYVCRHNCSSCFNGLCFMCCETPKWTYGMRYPWSFQDHCCICYQHGLYVAGCLAPINNCIAGRCMSDKDGFQIQSSNHCFPSTTGEYRYCVLNFHQREYNCTSCYENSWTMHSLSLSPNGSLSYFNAGACNKGSDGGLYAPTVHHWNSKGGLTVFGPKRIGSVCFENCTVNLMNTYDAFFKPPYSGTGFNGWLVDIPVWRTLMKPPYDGAVNSGNFNSAPIFEVQTDYDGLDVYKVCEHAFNCCSSYGGVLNWGPMFKRESGPVGGFRYRPCDLCVNRCFLSCYQFISKNPAYDLTDPSNYTVLVDTACSGVTKYVSHETLTNAVAYARNLSLDAQYYNGLMSCRSGCWTAANITSRDCCYIFHFYKAHPAICFCSACFAGCTSWKLCSDMPYAIEKIDTTTGEIVCSVYFCCWEDCTSGGSYPCAVDISPKNVDSVLDYAGFMCCTWCLNHRMGPLRDPFYRHMEGSPYGCYVPSVNCELKTFIISGTDAQVTVFNEATMNYDCTVNAFKCTAVANFIKEFYNGICGQCTAAKNLCLCCTFNCAYTLDYEPWNTLTCEGYGLMPADAAYRCVCVFFGLNPFMIQCGLQGSGEIGSYINPTNDHLVSFVNIMVFCSASPCIGCTIWRGAVCYDIANQCISAVDSLSSADEKCMYGLRYGQDSWGSIHYCDRPVGCPTTYFNFQAFNMCCLNHAIYQVGTYANSTKTEEGIVLVTNEGNNGNTTFNRLCSSCCCIVNNLGYFGSCCTGCCTICNATESNLGLNASTNFGITRIPHSQPLCCSPLFERNDTIKCLFEYSNGCHELGQAFYCNDPDRIWSDIKKYLCYPRFISVDITCQYTLGCTGVYTWGQCFCSALNWKIKDTSTDTFHVYDCCTLADCCALLCDLVFVSAICDYQCQAYCAPSVYKNIKDDTLFAGTTNHRVFSSSAGVPTYRVKYDDYSSRQVYCCANWCYPDNYGDKGFRKFGPTTGKGLSSLTVEWYNKCYVNVC